jgi:hypothetical protein
MRPPPLCRRAVSVQFALVWIVALGAVHVSAADEARALFGRYVELQHAFDPTAADLYANDAVIKNKRIYPDGQIRELTLPGAQYKALVRQAMPLAKARGDTNSYSNVTFTDEGSAVRIRATRFSDLKKYSSPLSLLVSPGVDRKWLIREELSESRP